MWRSKHISVMAFALAAALSLLSSIHAKELNIMLEHSLDGQSFTQAGFLQGSLFDSDFAKGEALTLNRADLSEAEQNLLADLVQKNQMYRIRLPSDPSNAEGPKISTSIPARCLISSGMRDHLQLHAAPNGNFVGINYDFATYPCWPDADVSLPRELSFPESSTVAVWMPVSAPVLTKVEKAFASGAKGKGGTTKSQPGSGAGGGQGDKDETPVDTRPWIIRNWMIALPLAFVGMNLLGALMGPQEAGGGAAAPVAGARRR